MLKNIKNFGSNINLLILFFILFTFATFISPAFLDFNNIQNIIRTVMVLGIISFGITMVMIVGEIDLSVGSIAAFSCAFGGLFVDSNSSLLVIMLTLFAGTFCGFLNGLGVTFFKVPSLIMTLGTMAIIRNAGYIMTNGQAAYPTKLNIYMASAKGYIGNIPIPVIIFILLSIIFTIIVRYSTVGKSLYVVGANNVASLLSGIQNNSAKIIAFTLCGLCCSIAGLIQSARLGQIDPHMGIGWELTVIAIAVLGGASLYGGKGSIEGTIIATLIIGVINNLLNLLGMSNHSQEVVIAFIIITMVLLHNFGKDAKR
ncbi:MAG: ABC transporter permease [Candidatus Puniceispirillales bacterium]|jgi:ribose transport system permease protein|tara:strand:+ start:3092 stop:4033 length:942 start_codon:yes stop_codon:yes gene_type:complete